MQSSNSQVVYFDTLKVMDYRESEVPETESREDKPQVKDSNGFLKSSNGHAMGSITHAKSGTLDDEVALAWHKQAQPYKIPKRKGKRKTESLPAVFCQWIVDHQIGKSVVHRG